LFFLYVDVSSSLKLEIDGHPFRSLLFTYFMDGLSLSFSIDTISFWPGSWRTDKEMPGETARAFRFFKVSLLLSHLKMKFGTTEEKRNFSRGVRRGIKGHPVCLSTHMHFSLFWGLGRGRRQNEERKRKDSLSVPGDFRKRGRVFLFHFNPFLSSLL